MAYFEVVSRSPADPNGNTTYFSEEGMGDWAFAPIIEMKERGFDGTVWQYDYLTMQMSSVPGFPQLYFRVYGHFTFKQDYTSVGTGKYVADGSIINMVEVIDASGKVYNRLSGISFAIQGDKTTTAIEPIMVVFTRFGELETPDEGWMMSGNDTVRGNNYGAELLRGYAGHDTVQGLGGNDVLHGEGGNDTLDGGADADGIYGGAGDDTIVGYTAGDYIDGGDNFDTWALTGTYVAPPALPPVLDMTGVTFYGIEAIRITYGEILLNSNQVGGASSVQTIFGGSPSRDMLRVAMAPGSTVMNLSSVDFLGWNNWSGEFDVITLQGTAAGDTIDGSEMNDVIYAYGGANTVRGGMGSDQVVGGAQADILRGGDKSDTLDGGAGNDVLIGDDDYAINASAQHGDDTIFGGAGDDVIMGLGGFNVVYGGDGQDTVDYGFLAQSPGDGTAVPVHVFIDLSRPVDPNNPESGFTAYVDRDYGEVFIPTSRDILVGVEHVDGSGYDDRIVGDGQANRLRGRGGNDSIDGGAGNDTLDGGTGTDSLVGGAGNDTFILGAAGDVIVEAAGGGIDTVRSDVSHALAGQVENLVLTGGAINGTGNDLNNVLTGNGSDNTLQGLEGNDRLDGGAGIDRLEGGLGNDLYIVTSAGDTIVEWAGGGSDTVQASISVTLAGEVETLLLTGSGNISGAGNRLNNVMTGNAGANTLRGMDGNDRLDGGAGIDRLEGGLGNDTYVLGLDGDTVVELAGGGSDTVLAGVSHTLAAEVEYLTLTGALNISGVGNGLTNLMIGNTGLNTLKGMDGNDRLDGRGGKDVLSGGAGSDSFQFSSLGEAGDAITDFTNLSGNNDFIRISAAGFGAGLVAGALLSASQFQIRADNVAQDSNDRFIFRTTDTTLWFDSNGNAAGGLTMIADLQAGATMSASTDIYIF